MRFSGALMRLALTLTSIIDAGPPQFHHPALMRPKMDAPAGGASGINW
jgi:hypothetical protein